MELVLIILTIAFAVVAIVLLLVLLNNKEQYEKTAADNKRLLAENALLEVDHLKFQLRPHTLKNILANLTTVANNLNTGMESLSETLDYILHEGDSNLVSIKEEVGFIEKYLKLNDLYVSEMDSIQLDKSQLDRSSTYFDTECIPHLITAHFIENAFKHGDTNHPEFLKISIVLTQNHFHFQVINKIRKKINKESRGLGLTNMQKRLELMQAGNHEVILDYNEHEYYSTLKIDFSK